MNRDRPNPGSEITGFRGWRDIPYIRFGDISYIISVFSHILLYSVRILDEYSPRSYSDRILLYSDVSSS